VNNLPNLFKVRLPAKETDDLEKMYDFFFDYLNCGWAGRFGHYAYGETWQIADKQDGFIYCFIHSGFRKITASTEGNITFNPKEAIEIDITQWKER
jgi:hypothetical protein